MAMLGIIWLLLLVIELTRSTPSPAVATANGLIWIIFAVVFLAEFLIAPGKGLYLRRHWFVLVSLALPALRVARAIRIARVVRVSRLSSSVRGVRLLRTLTSLNRAMTSLRATMRRRGFAYVSALTRGRLVAARRAAASDVPGGGGA